MTSFHPRAIAAAARIVGPCLLLFSSTFAWGQQNSASASDASARPAPEAAVVLMFDPHEEDALALVGSIEADLAGVPVRLIREPRTRTELLTWLEAGRRRVKATGALGLFAVDVTRREGWRLFFLEPDGIPTLIRRMKPIPEHAPLDEAGITVHLLVEALLDGKHVEVTEPVLQEEPPEAAGSLREPAREKSEAAKTEGPERAAHPEPELSGPGPAQQGSGSGASGSASEGTREAGAGGVHPAFVFGLSTTKWLRGQPWQSGILTGAAVYLNQAWSVSVDYLWYPTLRYEASQATIALLRHPFAGRVSYRPSAGFSPVFALGTWADALSRQTLDAKVGYHGTGSANEWSWGMSGSVGLASPRLSGLSACLNLGLDVAARNIGFVVNNETPETVLSTNAVRPFWGVLLDFRL